MDLYQQLPAQHVGQCLQLQVTLGSFCLFVSLLHLSVVLVPIADVLPCLLQGFALHLEVAHARRRSLVARSVYAFGILAAGKLDRARRIRKKHLIAAESELIFDDDRLPSDHVRRTVQQQQ